MRILLAACVALGLSGSILGQCRPVRYRTGRDYGAELNVSIRLRDFTIEKLVCLGRALRKGRRKWRNNYIVLFFDSQAAALNFLPAPIETQHAQWTKWADELHAEYIFDADKREERLNVYPVGFGSPDAESLSTTIDLHASARPSCHLQMEGRCLMAVLKAPAYSHEALDAEAAGAILLSGTIERDGAVSGLRVVSAHLKPSEEKDSLVNAALRSLESWRFDAAAREDQIRITFSYAIDTSLPHGAPVQVKWDLPNRVKIRARPPDEH